MKYLLLKMSASRLSHADFDSFVATQIDDLGNNLPPAMDIYQPVYQQYLAELKTAYVVYH